MPVGFHHGRDVRKACIAVAATRDPLRLPVKRVGAFDRSPDPWMVDNTDVPQRRIEAMVIVVATKVKPTRRLDELFAHEEEGIPLGDEAGGHELSLRIPLQKESGPASYVVAVVVGVHEKASGVINVLQSLDDARDVACRLTFTRPPIDRAAYQR